MSELYIKSRRSGSDYKTLESPDPGPKLGTVPSIVSSSSDHWAPVSCTLLCSTQSFYFEAVSINYISRESMCYYTLIYLFFPTSSSASTSAPFMNSLISLCYIATIMFNCLFIDCLSFYLLICLSACLLSLSLSFLTVNSLLWTVSSGTTVPPGAFYLN